MSWSGWLQLLLPIIASGVGGWIGWKLKERSESLRLAKEGIRQQRSEAYAEILEPLVSIIADTGNKNRANQRQRINAPDYRQKAFRLMLFGDDEVIRQWNGLWQTLYKSLGPAANTGGVQTDIGAAYLLHIGRLMLAIRKSLGYADTKLSEVDLYAWLIRDIEKLEAFKQLLAKHGDRATLPRD